MSSEVDFEKRIYDLKKIFQLDDFVNDYNDFFKFNKTFQAVRKRAALASKTVDEDALLAQLRDKLKMTDEQLLKLEIPSPRKCRGVAEECLKKFIVLLLSYLDFKETEKRAVLLKLKQSQESLPIFQYKNEILDSVEKCQVTIVAGDTGCGKSTQVPQYLMGAGYTGICCTQPRRLACIALSKRVAHETQNRFGEEVGFQIRFERKRRAETVILFLTEGLLLRQLASDPSLSDYNVVVLDEIHERHLHGDFLLGVLRCLLLQREDLKVVLMSATINIALFRNYFEESANVIQVPGRLYPIRTQFSTVPAERDDSKGKLNPEPYVQILQLIDQKYLSTERGDVLIFVSGFQEIKIVISAINAYNDKVKKWIVLPLYSALSITDQDKVFDYPPDGIRKCVVSTNIAETSVTIDGIRFVVDSGMVKEMSYDSTCKMQRLKEFWVSKASAEQRKGRAGRTGPGTCYRLYTEADYEAMTDYTTPEIQRVPLDSILLQMIAMGLPDARKFPFIEAPHMESIEYTIFSLKQHGALTEEEKITTVGTLLSKLPVDIQIGKMLITGSMFHQIEPAMSLAAALSVVSPFTCDAYRNRDCENLRSDLESDHGDPVTLLNCLRGWLVIKHSRDQGSTKSRQWCRKRGLEEQRLYEMCKIRSQFKELLLDHGLLTADGEDDMKSMTTGERALRHGEVKLLKHLKRLASSEENAERKKKYLKPDRYHIDKEEDRSAYDLRDIDFRLKNTQSQVQNLVSASTACSFTDLIILKLILANGLYPQIAIGDEFNHFKSAGEMLYHTKSKPYVSLHPTSYFGNHSEVLQLTEPDMVPHPRFNSRTPLSSRHQILFYVSLLETNKPYLMNTMRMPAAETVLLLAHQLHTNADCSRIICDLWIEITFPDSQTGETLLMRMIRSRGMWERLMKSRLNGKSCAGLDDELIDSLASTMNFGSLYSVKRLLAADIKKAFVGAGSNSHAGYNPFEPEVVLLPDDTVGGMKVTAYCTYDCLVHSPTIDDWKCPHCDLLAPLLTIQKYQHLNAEHPEQSRREPKAGIEAGLKAPAKNAIAYFCDICQENLLLTAVEVLRHRKSHACSA